MEELKIEKNYYNGGLCCVFTHGGQEYFADLCHVLFSDYNECMIFKSKDGQVTDWGELYCKRGLAVTEENLAACVDEFTAQLNAS